MKGKRRKEAGMRTRVASRSAKQNDFCHVQQRGSVNSVTLNIKLYNTFTPENLWLGFEKEGNPVWSRQ